MRTKSIKGKYLIKQDRILLNIVDIHDREYLFIFTRRMVIISLNTIGKNLKFLLAQKNVAKNPTELDKALSKGKKTTSSDFQSENGPVLIQQIKFSTEEKNKITVPMISFFYDEASSTKFMFPIQLINILSRLLTKLHLQAHWNIPNKIKKVEDVKGIGLPNSKKKNLH